MTNLLIIAYGYALRVGLRTIIESDPTLEVVADIGGINEIPDEVSDTDVILFAAESVLEDEFEELEGLIPEGIGLLVLSDDPVALSLLPGGNVSAWGVLPFNAAFEEIKPALRAIAAGLVVVSPLLLSENAETAVFLSGLDQTETLVEPLTPRELEVLQILALGYPNKTIATKLIISEHTVKFHISSIYGKLGAANRAEAVRLGVRLGLISV